MTVLVEDDDTFIPYHDGVPKRSSQVDPEIREFIAWDGEGINVDGQGKPQHYVLFGCSTGDRILSPTHIHTFDLLDLIINVGLAHPTAFHVGFSFNYDSNQIVRSLHPKSLEILHKKGQLTLNRLGRKYHIQFRPSKWFSVTKYGDKYDRKNNPHDKTTVKIYDLFGFFATSFEAAYTKHVGKPNDSVVSEGKANRGNFTSLEYVERYWEVEIQQLRELAEILRKRLYGAGLRITEWHGPGALASHALRQHGIKSAMAVCPEQVRTASRYAYAGGRFEMFRLGRTVGPIYSLDINSAYPYGISQLPNLAIGRWERRIEPRRIARFGVYRVRLLPRNGDSFLEQRPGPLFHRDALGNISFPWVSEGWYWSPEIRQLARLNPDRFEILEGWEYVGGYRGERPFSFVAETYTQRKQWKKSGIPAEYALKLLLNSLYGKMAQRIGWNEEKRTAPTWHQLEWAGWVTSNTRAMLWDLMSRIPFEKLLAVETDGLYTTQNPTELGIEASEELGGWEIKQYDEILYVQSGLAWLRTGDEWEAKRRGLDRKTFSLEDCVTYLKQLGPREEWPPYKGETTRFIGLGAALNSSAPMKVRHGVWETVEREVRPGQGGKRVHIHGQCDACRRGLSAWESAHDMSIRSMAYVRQQSSPHDIPWEDSETRYPWRDYAERQGEVVR